MANDTVQDQPTVGGCNIWLFIARIFLAAAFAAGVVAYLAGCAYTKIETPMGTYWSSRDTTVDTFEAHVIEHPDGRVEKIIKLGGAGGLASPVVQAQAAALSAAIESAYKLGRAVP